jgi:hypothetical protein
MWGIEIRGELPMKISLWVLSVLCTGLTVGVLSAFIAAARKLTSRQQQWVAAFGVLGISLLGGAAGKLIFHLELEKWTGIWSQTLIGQSLWLGAATGTALFIADRASRRWNFTSQRG